MTHSEYMRLPMGKMYEKCVDIERICICVFEICIIVFIMIKTEVDFTSFFEWNLIPVDVVNIHNDELQNQYENISFSVKIFWIFSNIIMISKIVLLN